jgi:hypothetical protein
VIGMDRKSVKSDRVAQLLTNYFQVRDDHIAASRTALSRSPDRNVPFALHRETRKLPPCSIGAERDAPGRLSAGKYDDRAAVRTWVRLRKRPGRA